MIVTLETVEHFPLVDLGPPRSPGVHVSEIIRCIATETGYLKYELIEELSLLTKKDMSDLDIVSQLRIHMGFAWESYYIPLIPGVVKHPGELQVDNIFMTPDGEEMSVIVTGDGPIKRRRPIIRVHEVKFTYKSTNTVGDFTSQFMWLAQIKSYCYAKKTRLATSHVLFACGDYSYPIRPILNKYHIEFTKQELEDNWKLMTEYRDHRMEIEA